MGAGQLDCTSLTVANADGAHWTWFSRRDEPSIEQLARCASAPQAPTTHIAIGEPAFGLDGWRRSHREASAAFHLALRKPGVLIRYADHPLLISALRDELLQTCLHDVFLAPLATGLDDGSTLRHTLRAYFAADRNGASAAAQLEVARQTVKNRLDAVEQRVGRPISSCGPELETALTLHELSHDQ